MLQMDMDLKLFGSGMDVKPGTPPVSARSTTPTSSPYRYYLTSPLAHTCTFHTHNNLSNHVYMSAARKTPVLIY